MNKSEYLKEYYQKNIEREKEKRRDYYKLNRKKILKKSKEYCKSNKNEIKEYQKQYFIENAENITQYKKEWYILNKERVIKNRAIYERKRKSIDVNYRILGLLRRRILNAIHGKSKSNTTLNLLNCSIDYLKTYLQQTAIKNGYLDFDINNYSGKDYHIDHIIPCDVFNLSCSYHQKLCFHWNNLQILKAKENIRKSNRIEEIKNV